MPDQTSRAGRFGPGFLVAAAFIGPGTVTTASVTGANYGTALLWTVLFSVVATMVLQEMSARLGLVTRSGLGEALRTTFANPMLRMLTILLVLAAIAIGNAAFQMGNITGAAIGLELLTGLPRRVCALAIGGAAILVLALGGYVTIERLLTGLVALMGLLFLATAVAVKPDLAGMLGGALVPRIPSGASLTIIALIGTTVVPYNLFLHASSVQEKWAASVPLDRSLREARRDTLVSIAIGGAITAAIVITASAAYGDVTQINGAADMAEQLKPLLGTAAGLCFATGLAAAGLTSAVTAPLAAAYATAGVLGFRKDLRSTPFRAVWAAIAIIGTGLAMADFAPVKAIVFAQVANGLLLPIVALFLLITLNRGELLHDRRNGPISNILGGAIVLFVFCLSAYKLLKLFGAVGS